MGRIKKTIRYSKRYKNIWYYKLKNDNWKSAGTTLKREAIKIAEQAQLQSLMPQASKMTFKEYADTFFIPGKCPRARRLEAEGAKPTDRYLSIQRLNLETHAFTSPLSKKILEEIKRADILDFRDSLISKGLQPSTINKIVSAVKTVFSEAEYREDLLYNPTAGVRNVKEKKSEISIFTEDEIRILFNKEEYEHIWSDYMAYTCFFFTYNTGMRRSEVLALRWEHINFNKKYVTIEVAWKDTTTLGKPKSNKPRHTPLSDSILEVLEEYKKKRFLTKDSDLIFSYCDGSRLGETWWRKNFNRALDNANYTKTRFWTVS